MLLWSASITTAMSFAKMLDSETSGFALVFLRCSFGFLFTLPFVFSSGLKAFKTKRHPLHFLRVCFNCSALACTYYAYRHLPLAEASAIGLTEPLLTTLMAALILKDKVSLGKWLTIIGGYLGVLIIANPTDFIVNHALWILLFANFSASASLICTKMLSSSESTVLILTYTNIIGIIFSGLIALPYWKTPNGNDIWIMVCVGLFGIISQLSYVRALKLGSPAFLSPFEYMRFVIAIPVGFFVFKEALTLQIVLGGFLIILATYWLNHLENRERA
jgi:drug/metabolite transporter (DMT)-like permease